MTDTNTQTVHDNTQTSDAEKAKANVPYGIGDTITVKLGKLRGQSAKILAEDKTKDTFAVQTDDGTLEVIWRGNVRQAEEPLVTTSSVVRAFANAGLALEPAILAVLERIEPKAREMVGGTSDELL